MEGQGLLEASSNRTCQYCELHETTHFCKCAGTPAFFCMSCFSKHNVKNPRAPHQVLPIAVLNQNPEEYKRRYETLTKASAELRSNVAKMEQCSREFSDMMQHCINSLVEHRTQWLQQLQTNKEELSLAIETAIQEATDCLDQGVEPASALGRAMWTRPTEELQVFEYTVSAPDFSAMCQSWAYYKSDLKSFCLLVEEARLSMQQVRASLNRHEEAKLPPLANIAVLPAVQPQAQLVKVDPSFFQLFDFQTGDWKQRTPLNPHIQADGYSRWVILEDGKVFICGGGWWLRSLNTAYIIVGDQSEEKAKMYGGRYYHGVLAYSNHIVYVFGGWNVLALNSCEKYNLQQNTWTSLPCMVYARRCFNPCLFKGNIYLCGYSSLLEAFSPQKDEMLPFRFSITAAMYSCSCMYVENDLLVLHLDKNILKFKAGLDGKLISDSRSSTQMNVMEQNSQPVVDTVRRLYYIVYDSKCYCVNMDTGAVSQATH